MPPRFAATIAIALSIASPLHAGPRCTALADHPLAVAGSVTAQAAGGACRIEGVLRPVAGSRIGYRLWLPESERWTGRLQMLGNGGYSSDMPLAAMEAALARGNAVVATDTGHNGDDPAFARDAPQAIVDWGWRAVHSTIVAAKALTTRFYSKPPTRSYFTGCSTGGHQAMMEAQRFPADFDGIVAGAPGADRVRLNAAFLWQFLANHRPGDDAHPILDAADLKLLQDQALRRCRSAGNAAGRWLVAPLSCRPDPQVLQCRPGETSDCLSPEKVAAARRMYAGARDPATSKQLTFPYLPGSETGWSSYWADPRQPDQPARVGFWRWWAFTPGWTWRIADIATTVMQAQARLSPVIDATNPDLSAFRNRGGKLLQYHGLADPVVSPLDTLHYRARVAQQLGSDRRALDRWYRLVLIPGMGHCGGGPVPGWRDLATSIEQWVEHGTAPERL